MFSARKRSVSRGFVCAKAQRQQQHRCRSVSRYRMDAMVLG